MSSVTWKVYGSCGDSFEIDGGATPPYEEGDGVTCPECVATVRVEDIEAAVL